MAAADKTATPPLPRIGTAAWAIPRAVAAQFAGEGSQLQRYARVMACTEINSSFYRSHRPETYEKWAAETPPGFRFSVKLPRTITHDRRLLRAREPLRRFLEELAGLGDRLGALLVQLPPSLAFEPRQAARFFTLLRELHGGGVVIEPRHASWFTPAAERLLVKAEIARAAADPARSVAAAQPGGWTEGLRYYRWHGSPRMYWSGYADAWLAQRLGEIDAPHRTWCIFDNTAAGQALPNALALQAMAGAGHTRPPPTG